jgi:hypothetical protein
VQTYGRFIASRLDTFLDHLTLETNGNLDEIWRVIVLNTILSHSDFGISKSKIQKSLVKKRILQQLLDKSWQLTPGHADHHSRLKMLNSKKKYALLIEPYYQMQLSMKVIFKFCPDDAKWDEEFFRTTFRISLFVIKNYSHLKAFRALLDRFDHFDQFELRLEIAQTCIQIVDFEATDHVWVVEFFWDLMFDFWPFLQLKNHEKYQNIIQNLPTPKNADNSQDNDLRYHPCVRYLQNTSNTSARIVLRIIYRQISHRAFVENALPDQTNQKSFGRLISLLELFADNRSKSSRLSNDQISIASVSDAFSSNVNRLNDFRIKADSRFDIDYLRDLIWEPNLGHLTKLGIGLIIKLIAKFFQNMSQNMTSDFRVFLKMTGIPGDYILLPSPIAGFPIESEGLNYSDYANAFGINFWKDLKKTIKIYNNGGNVEIKWDNCDRFHEDVKYLCKWLRSHGQLKLSPHCLIRVYEDFMMRNNNFQRICQFISEDDLLKSIASFEIPEAESRRAGLTLHPLATEVAINSIDSLCLNCDVAVTSFVHRESKPRPIRVTRNVTVENEARKLVVRIRRRQSRSIICSFEIA